MAVLKECLLKKSSLTLESVWCVLFLKVVTLSLESLKSNSFLDSESKWSWTRFHNLFKYLEAPCKPCSDHSKDWSGGATNITKSLKVSAP